MNFFQKAKKIYTEGGLRELIIAGHEFTYYNLARIFPFFGGPVYQKTRMYSTIERWEKIDKHLTKDDKTLLDIGCNAGFFTVFAARKGIFSLGVDMFTNQFTPSKKYAAKQFVKNENLGFIQMKIDLRTIKLLPVYDVILLLSVYHHWYIHYGKKDAERMLGHFKGAKKIFFEPPSLTWEYTKNDNEFTPKPTFKDEDRVSVIRYHKDLLTSVFGDGYRVKVIGESRKIAHSRYIFLVEKMGL